VDEKGKVAWIKVYEILHVPDIEEVVTALGKQVDRVKRTE